MKDSSVLQWSSADWTSTQPNFRRSSQSVSPVRPISFDQDLSQFGWGVTGATWERAEEHLRELLSLEPNWDTYDGHAPSRETVAFAAAQLSSLKELKFPPPTISPSGEGAILATWAGKDIEIELWFDGPYRETVLIDDSRHELESPDGVDPLLSRTTQALRKLLERA